MFQEIHAIATNCIWWNNEGGQIKDQKIERSGERWLVRSLLTPATAR